MSVCIESKDKFLLIEKTHGNIICLGNDLVPVIHMNFPVCDSVKINVLFSK